MLGQGASGHEPETVVERPRADRRDDLVRLGRREDEPHVRRGLLDDLQQGVGGRRAQLMGLVDDVDLEPARGGGIGGLLAQIPGVVDQPVGRSVHLHDVDRPRTVRRQLHAAATGAARLGRGSLLAVERSGHDPGGGRLPTAPRTGEQVGVVDPARFEGARQRLGHVLLADHLSQRARPVGPVERQCHVAHPNGARRQHPQAVGATPGDNRGRDPSSPSHPHLGITHTCVTTPV